MNDPELFPQITGALTARSADLLVRAADRTDLVLVAGDLDLDSTQTLHHGLRDRLDRSLEGITLDLREVGFCDCSGLNVLLRLRHRALAQGKTISIRGASPQVERLLGLTNTTHLFGDTSHAYACPEDRRPSPAHLRPSA
ncbi:STAS domain-containing protein [Streptomyces sp. NPDC001691]|uniref:STAS domain-containing protein n=1 Tax=Streptomyces sp. NPDC001691 TaxID=3364600 RepID=UPI0036B422D0